MQNPPALFQNTLVMRRIQAVYSQVAAPKKAIQFSHLDSTDFKQGAISALYPLDTKGYSRYLRNLGISRGRGTSYSYIRDTRWKRKNDLGAKGRQEGRDIYSGGWRPEGIMEEVAFTAY